MPRYQKKIAVPGRTARELYETVASDLNGFLSKNAEQEMAGMRFELKPLPDLLAFELKASLVNALLKCENELLTLEGNMGILILPFKPKIDAWIEGWINKKFKR